MTSKEKFIKALKREPITGHVPHFELVFFLTMEALGKIHPLYRSFYQWGQMSKKEKALQVEDAAATYVAFAKKYNHSAIFIKGPLADFESYAELIKKVREMSEGEYFLLVHGDGTFAIPGSDMMEFSAGFFEKPAEMHALAKQKIDSACDSIQKLLDAGAPLDGIGMCSDYCFNNGPFWSPGMFSEFVAPYLTQQIERYHEMGLYVIKHTDGNIMPILDQLAAAKPDALHSLDPQGQVDLRLVKEKYGKELCLIGNVNCGLLQSGTDEEVTADVLRALRDGMPGYGYIFSTSNCVFPGLPLERYELMHSLWRKHGVYPESI